MEPFLKWAGGKRWLTSAPVDLFPKKTRINRYFEPFLGSGAVFFYLSPSSGYLSDLNSDLINAYLAIRDKWQELYEYLLQYHFSHSPTFYYKIRSSNPRGSLQKAARFIYLNRTCWNGLYRVNKKGKFNVPIGTKTNVLFEEDDFEKLSIALNSMNIHACDFEITIDKAQVGDFVFTQLPRVCAPQPLPRVFRRAKVKYANYNVIARRTTRGKSTSLAGQAA